MRILEQKTGETALQKGLQQYLSQNAYGNAGWADLIDILNTTKTDELPRWSASWVDEAGRPHLKAIAKGRDLVIEQHDPFAKNRVWPQELELAFSENGDTRYQKVIMNSAKTELKNLFPEGKPEWIYLNAKGNTYGFVELDSISRNYFLNHFSAVKDDLFRASLITDLTENLHEGKLNVNDYLNLLVQQLTQETNSVIFERILNDLESCFIYQATAEQQKAIQEEMEAVLWKEYAVRKNQQTALVNSIMRLAQTGNSLTRLETCLKNPMLQTDIKLSADQQNDLAFQLALKLPEKAMGILDSQEKQIINQDKKAQFQFVRKSLNPDRTERNRFFESLLQEKNREHEPWVEQAMAFLNHPIREKESLEYIRPALDKLQEIKRTGDIFFPKSWLDSLLKGHNSKEAASIVRQFLADHPDYPEDLKMKILQSADHLLRM